MQFKVPQNLEVEDRIFGNFSFRQIVYIGGSLGLSYMLWVKFPMILAIPIVFGIIAFAWALAFLPKERLGRPFSVILESSIKFLINNKLYTWRKIQKKQKPEKKEKVIVKTSKLNVPNISESRLAEISWNIGIK